MHAVPATRTIRGIPTEVALDRDDGMPEPCVISLANLQLLDVDLLERRICTLGHVRLHEVCAALSLAVDC